MSTNYYDNAKWYALEQKILDEYNTANGTSLTTLDGVASDIVLPIKVNGVYWSMHSDYFFDLKKTYSKEPTRALDGSIKTFPVKFFVPYFKIKYAVIFMADYYKAMKDIQPDEVTVQYYDSFYRVYRVAKFYAQQPTYSTLYTMKGDYRFVTDLEIIFAGTRNDLTEATVTYTDPSGTNPNQTANGYVGDEFAVKSASAMSRSGYTLASWNTASNGSGITYIPDSKAVFTGTNITLYAMWVAN